MKFATVGHESMNYHLTPKNADLLCINTHRRRAHERCAESVSRGAALNMHRA